MNLGKLSVSNEKNSNVTKPATLTKFQTKISKLRLMEANLLTIRASSKAIKKYIILCWFTLLVFFLGWLYLSYEWAYDSEDFSAKGKLAVILSPLIFIMFIHEIKRCSIFSRETTPLAEINKNGIMFLEKGAFFKWSELKTIKLSKNGIWFLPTHRFDGALEIPSYLVDRPTIFQAARLIKQYAPAEKTKHLKDKLINRY